MLLSRIFSPSVNVRLFDPMPLPRRTQALRRDRIAVMNLQPSAKTASVKSKEKTKRRFTYKVSRIPLNA